MTSGRRTAFGLKVFALAALLAPAGLLLAQSTVPNRIGARDPLAEAFVSPPKSARPDVRWWWPGDAVEDAEIEREIALLDKAGFGGAEIQSFNPGIPDVAPSERAAVAGFAEPPFFAHVRTAARAAGRRGLRLDYTFGSSWPSGGGRAITPERALIELSMAFTPVEGGAKGPIKIAIPSRTKRLGAFGFDSWARSDEGKEWRERFDTRARIISVRAYRGEAPTLADKPGGGVELTPWRDVRSVGRIDPSSGIDLSGRLAADGTLDWSPPAGKWLVFVFKQYASNSGVLGASGNGPQLVLDHYDPKAFEAHAARVGTPLLDSLGEDKGGLRATFIDSLELFQDLPWSESFLAEFGARRGYDLTPYLPFIVQPGWMTAWSTHYSPPYFDASGDPHLAERVRADYRETVSDLMIESFIKPWIAWNHENGLKVKFQAHGAPIDTLRGYGLADIPETEDLHDDADPDFLRLARSAAHIYGRPIVSAEAMVWGGRPFSVTPEEMKTRADRLFASGVTAQTIHGFSYRFHADKWPGWFAFQPTAFGGGFSTMLQEANPTWPAVPVLTAYMTRLNAVLRQGEAVVPVAALHDRVGFYKGMDGHGDAAHRRTESLLAGGYDYDRINPHGLAASRVERGMLVTPGGHRFAALVLPAIQSLRAETAEQIAAFAEQGLPVFFAAGVPDRETGLLDFRARDRRVRNAMARAIRAGGTVVPDAKLVEQLRAARIPANLQFTAGHTDLIFVERLVGRRHVYFLHNMGKEDRDASFVVAGTGRAERWDAMTGAVTPMTAPPRGQAIDIPLMLAPGASALILIDPSGRPTSPLASTRSANFDLPGIGWRFEARGHGAGGSAVSQNIGSVALGDWKEIGLGRFSGTGTYSRTFRLPSGWPGGKRRVEISLSGVHDMATIRINGRDLPPLIAAPWTVDATSVLRKGENNIEIRVANVPQNALLDIAKPGYRDLKPVAAGLHGPVSFHLVNDRPRSR